MIPSARLVVWFILVLGNGVGMVQGGERYSTQYPCHQQESSLVVLERDHITGNFSVVYRMQPGEPLSLPGVQVRNLVIAKANDDKEVHFLRHQLSTFPGIVATDANNHNDHAPFFRGLQAGDQYANFSVDDDSGPLFYAWECSCFGAGVPIAFCPLDIDTCLQPYRPTTNQVPGCHNLPKAYDFRRYSFLITIVWFFAILTALVTSRHGPFLFGFLISKCFPSWNDRAVDRLLQGHPDQVRDMIRIYIIREQRALFEARRQQDMEEAAATTPANTTSTGGDDDTEETHSHERHQRSENHNDEPKSPRTSLVLRTKKYSRPTPRIMTVHQVDDIDAASDTDEDRCTICFLSFDDGDRIGSLKCNHLFHSDCLKQWLQRRNACPLCQVPEIAQPRLLANVSDTEATASPIDSHLDSTTNSSFGPNNA